MGTDTFNTSRLPIAVPRYFSFHIHTHTLPLSLSLSVTLSAFCLPSLVNACLSGPPVSVPLLRGVLREPRGGDMSRKQRRGGGKKWATSCEGAATESRAASSYQRTGGPPFDVRARWERWPSLALTCLWLMSTGQWFREAEIAPLLRGPLIWSTWAWNHSSRRETRFLLGGTWTLLRHASPSPALCLCYYISYNFSRARSVTLGMATLDLFVCPATPVCTDMNFFTVSGGWILLVKYSSQISTVLTGWILMTLVNPWQFKVFTYSGETSASTRCTDAQSKTL